MHSTVASDDKAPVLSCSSLSLALCQKISSCFLHPRSAEITPHGNASVPPLPSPRQQGHFSQSHPLLSDIPLTTAAAR